MKVRKISKVGAIVVLGVALCFFAFNYAVQASFWTDSKGAKGQVTITSDTFPNLVKKLEPSVVNISVVKVEKTFGMPAPGHGFGPFRGEGDPFQEFWEHFFGNRVPREFRQRGLGSGFIISKDGYILTNHHVVEGADEIRVVMHDKSEYPAKVVGIDSKTDIALIKIEPKEPLTVAVLGNSDDLVQGEPVLAIGNPFGLSETATTGIVSATGRVIGAGPYDDFIQTDASINPGNSGGPLFNVHGEVVGINTAIVASGQGIGFAVPINMAKSVLEQLRTEGKVTRGWLGVVIQSITPELAEKFGLADKHGALVSDVAKGDPADRAGIHRGDVIVEFNGEDVPDSHALPQMVAQVAPGTEVPVVILRKGKRMEFKVTLGTLKDEGTIASETAEKKRLGLTVQTVTPDLAKSLGMTKAQGVVVSNVEPGSPAGEAGLMRGDVIIEVDNKEVASVDEFKELISGVKSDNVLLLVWRKGSTFFLTMNMP